MNFRGKSWFLLFTKALSLGGGLILFLAGFSLAAAAIAPSPQGLTCSVVTEQEDNLLSASPYGEVIFHRSGRAEKQLYIIGQNHRSLITGESDPETLQAQMEIFRTGEWLIRQRQVELLLPEGFFGPLSPEDGTQARPAGVAGNESPWPDSPTDEVLRAQLADPRRFANAASLLNSHYGLPLAQVEDRELYHTVADSFRRLVGSEDPLNADLVSRLNCFQERRTAALLQKIPTVIGQEIQPGKIHFRKGLFIIGMAHIAEIIHFLEQERIELTPLPEDADLPVPRELSLLQEDYDITVILPRSLAENEEALRLTKLLDKIRL